MIVAENDGVDFVFTEDDMYNPEYKTEFVGYKYSNYSKKSLAAITNILKKIGVIEKDKGKDVAFFTLDDFVDLFRENDWFDSRAVSASKTTIREYMRWYILNKKDGWAGCDIRGTINLVFCEQLPVRKRYSKDFFLSIEELQAEINMVYEYISPRKVDFGEYNISTAASYLAWYGVTCEEASNIKKSNISRTDNTISLENKIVELDRVSMDFIRKYADSNGYYVPTRGEMIIKNYAPSEYLFRGIEIEQIPASSIRTNLSNFAAKPYRFDGENKKFRYDSIRFSGIYYRMIKYENTHGIKLSRSNAPIFENFFEEKYDGKSGASRFYVRFRNFERYKQYYYSKNNT